MKIRYFVQMLTWLSIFAMLWLMITKVLPADFASWGWVMLFAFFALGSANADT